MSTSFLKTSPRQTQKLGEKTAKDILKARNRRRAMVLGLTGGLGGGKTTFLQGFAKGLGEKNKILSPTFIIMRRINLACRQARNFYHIDCYRLKEPQELLDLDFKKIIADSKNIVAVEWADQVKEVMPRGTEGISFAFIDDKTRKIMDSTLKK